MPPDFCIKAIRAPTNNVNKTTRVLPASLKTLTTASIVAIVPVKRLKSDKITQPIHIPVIREINT